MDCKSMQLWIAHLMVRSTRDLLTHTGAKRGRWARLCPQRYIHRSVLCCGFVHVWCCDATATGIFGHKKTRPCEGRVSMVGNYADFLSLNFPVASFRSLPSGS